MGATNKFTSFAQTHTHTRSAQLLWSHRAIMHDPLFIIWQNKQLHKEMISYASHKYRDSVHNKTLFCLQEVKWWEQLEELTHSQDENNVAVNKRCDGAGSTLFHELALTIDTDRKMKGNCYKKA